MKKSLAMIGALAIATAAGAQTTAPEPVNTRTHNANVYDGPGPGAPGQPAPVPGQGPITRSTPAEAFTPTPRADYPVCSETVRDNCVQRIDPGGSPA